MTFTKKVPKHGAIMHPQWRLLQQHLETKGPGRPGDDMKDELRTDGDPIAWRIWSTALARLPCSASWA